MNLTVATRQYIYSVFIALSPIAIAYGIVTHEDAGLWLALIGAILGLSNGLALANTRELSKLLTKLNKPGDHEA